MRWIRLLPVLLMTFLCFIWNAGKLFAQPNVVLIFCDDLGYGDLSCFGSVWNKTPELDQMALEGVRFTDFYAGAPVCTPSRAGLLTGCYARRVGMDRDAEKGWVLFPVSRKGLNQNELTIPEAMKEAGYASAIIGKWHLGDQPVFFPTRHGFDFWFGIPYSNDMEVIKRGDPPLPLMRNEVVIEQHKKHREFDQSTLTKRYTDEAIRWMDQNRGGPFFLYLAHTMPHNPVDARDEFMDLTRNPKQGFGACVAEISWSTGQILDYLKEQNLDQNTLVIFTSDNGGQPRWGASNGILRGHKGQTFEGGVRVPFIAWWPGKIKPSSTCYHPASVLDFFATFTSLADIKIEDGVKRDGMDITEYLFNPEKAQSDRPYFYWHNGFLEAVRVGPWKLHLAGSYSRRVSTGSELYNLIEDPGEQDNRVDNYPEIVEELAAMIRKEKEGLGEDSIYGPEVRPASLVDHPEPIKYLYE